MEIIYRQGALKTNVYYGETFASQLKNLPLDQKHIFLITNQRYYDLFADKLIQLFGNKQELDWYICKNDPHCNNFRELENVLSFLSEFDLQEHFLFLGIGNEGVIQLTTFLQQSSMVTSSCWLLPLSIRSFSKSLLGNSQIELHNLSVLQTEGLAEKIVYDHTLILNQKDGKLIDFFVFIRCGLVANYDFLRMLFKNYTDSSRLKQPSFTGLLGEMMRYYEEQGIEIDQFGRLFECGFHEQVSGHLLSGPMKSFLGCLLQLLWSQEVNQFPFHFKNFIIWLIHLGFPVDFPEQILVRDYVEGVLQCIRQGETAIILEEIGKTNGTRKPTAAELLATVENYKTILKEIRG
ncbi:hypothetical protein GIX45_09900 [Erwinia sp. CPCC 100877]|nr:hypothetical protein [Erwinia sp. CPCC 100877]